MPQAPVAPVARVAPVAPVTYCCRLSKVSHTCVASNAGTTRKRNATTSNTRKLPSCKFQTCDFCYFDSESIIIIISGCSVVARWLLVLGDSPPGAPMPPPAPPRPFICCRERETTTPQHTHNSNIHTPSQCVTHTTYEVRCRQDAGKTPTTCSMPSTNMIHHHQASGTGTHVRRHDSSPSGTVMIHHHQV